MQGIEHLRAPAHKEHMQGMQGIEHLRAPAPKEPMQGMPRCSICPHLECVSGAKAHEMQVKCPPVLLTLVLFIETLVP
jgi:hypothetical protein